jgi:hypothetical protein
VNQGNMGKLYSRVFIKLVLAYLISFHCVGQQTGIIKTERSKALGIVSFSESSKLTGITNSNHIDGYVKKYGSNPFTFPVGNNGLYRPFAASADGTTGAYFKGNPSSATLPAGAPFSASKKETAISKVSTKEFWDVNGTKETKLTFTYLPFSDITGLTESDLSKLSIVGWDAAAAKWVVISSTVDEIALLGGSSALTSGSITTTQAIIPDSFSVYGLASLTSSSVSSVFIGRVENVECSEVTGWVWNKSYPESSVMVELLEGSVVRATVTANDYREDLKNSGIGTGRYGFRLLVPASLKDGKSRSLSLRVRGSSYILANSPFNLSCSYAGKFSSANCYLAKGWVWEADNPNKSLTVDLMEGSNVVGSGVANIYDANLKNQGIGNGKYAFAIDIPAVLKTGQQRTLSVRVNDSNYMLPGSLKSITCVTPLYIGKFEGADCKTVRGWAWDKNNPADALVVELVEGNTVYATATAGTLRDELLSSGYGTGKYGFSFAFPETLKDGKAHDLAVRIKGTGVILSNSPRTVTCAVPSSYSGDFESVDCDSVRGWAWDKNYPDSAVTVELLEGSTVRATAVASVYRSDVKSKGYGTGKYGFSIALPAILKDGNAHSLSVRVKGSSTILTGSARTVSCGYEGVLELVDCSVIKGYALDKGRQDNAVEVEIIEGTTVRMTIKANGYRSDLLSIGNGRGQYGFSQAFPGIFKDGQPHELKARIKGTNYYLTNSPKTITCALPAMYVGDFESLDCDVVRGYVWDKNYPDKEITVELMEGNMILASALSTTYRSDLKSQGYGTGKYGFSFALPASVKDGNLHQLSVRVKGTGVLLSNSPRSVTCTSLPQYVGKFEGADCKIVRGYVWDKAYPEKTLTVELVEGNKVYGTAIANMDRPDLLELGYGTGKYGFSFALPEALKDGQVHELNMRIKGTSKLLSNTRTVTCAVPSSYSGDFESVDCDSVRGWAWDKNYPDSAVTVELLEGSTVRATAVASVYRSDVKSKGYGTGKYGFSIALPAILKDGNAHSLSVRVKGSSTILTGSAKTVSCGYEGVLELVDCSVIKGYALDKGRQDNAVEVEILEGKTVKMTVTANVYRSDLLTIGNGSGKYGFTRAFPAGLKDGQSHELSARIKGTNYYLNGSPMTATCPNPNARITVQEDTPQIEMALGETNMEVVVAPNPTSGECWIVFTMSQNTSATVFVSDLSGVAVWTERVDGELGKRIKHKIDLSNRPPGVYVVQLRYDGNKIETKKVVVSK